MFKKGIQHYAMNIQASSLNYMNIYVSVYINQAFTVGKKTTRQKC